MRNRAKEEFHGESVQNAKDVIVMQAYDERILRS